MIRLHKLPPGFHVCEDEQEAGGFSFQDFRFGRLVPLAAVMGNGEWHKQPRYILFRCDCGRVVKRGIVGIRRKGIPDTCGKKCRMGPLGVKRKPGRQPKPKHHPVYGDLDAPAYVNTVATWHYNKKNMCKRWRDAFEWFAKDMGLQPKGLTLCRRDWNLQHSPENSLWDHFGSDRSKIAWCGHKVTVQWFSDRFNIPYYYVAKRSWDSKGIADCKEIIIAYRKYQQRLKARSQK